MEEKVLDLEDVIIKYELSNTHYSFYEYITNLKSDGYTIVHDYSENKEVDFNVKD